jgi:very-short-patch-repair endonuclease
LIRDKASPHTPAMSDDWRFSSGGRNRIAKRDLAALADRQFGRVRWEQLLGMGIGRATICRWTADGYLYPELPRVYAVGHRTAGIEGQLAAALLYAGPGSMLSHDTGVWWLGLLKYRASAIHISTPRRCASLDGVIVHGRRKLDRVVHNLLPVTSVAQTLQDYAQRAPIERFRYVLANADYNGWLDLEALDAARGPGARNLHEALRIHRPELAHTRSEFERAFIPFCERHRIRVPEFNVYINGHLVDAVWRKRKVIVELDSLEAHRTRAQLESDHRRDLELRAAGWTILRYTWFQLTETPNAVAADLRRYL